MWYLIGAVAAAAAILLLIYNYDVLIRPMLDAVLPSAEDNARRRAAELLRHHQSKREDEGPQEPK